MTELATHVEHAPLALELEGLDVVYNVRGRDRQVLRGVSLEVKRGEAYGLVGESGCGKSTAALAIVNYLPRNGRVRSGRLRIDGRDALSLTEAQLRKLRSESVSMVYQNPGTALNPSIRIGKQVAEVFRIRGNGRDEATDLARHALERVQIADPGSVMGRYPHQLSGGMQQRVVIAMALATEPALLILDEPTTGLDATVEAEVLDLVARLQAELRTSVLFISHNLGIIRKMCDRVGVLYAGRLVEEGDTETVLRDPRHPYTVGLLRCVPRGGVRKDHGRLDTIPGFMPNVGEELPGCVFVGRCTLAEERCHMEEPPVQLTTDAHMSRCFFSDRAQSLPRESAAELALPAVDRGAAPLLQFDDLGKVFRQAGHDVHALVGVSAAIWPGETLGLVGESGSGKTTLARTLLGILQPTSGAVLLEGRELGGALGKRTGDDLRSLQIVFQNPDSALNRRHQVRRILRRALKKLAGITGGAAEERMLELMRSVRLAERYVSARPSSLSGGLKQRLAIARAFAGDPKLVVCDEPTSALDVSVQAAILNLLVELQAQQGVSYLFISHDLGVVRYISDRIAVLYLGRLMELGPSEAVFSGPHHPYTEALLSAVPTVDGAERERIRLEGDIPSAASPPTGCVFHTRCPRRLGAICDEVEPPLVEVEEGHLMRCHISLEELRSLQAAGAPPARREVKV
ncbi:oligo-HPY: oligopeptide/dipeptide ABC transporter [Gaiella occulta]|uniref:Oligo-HPY: oligopeptide/dipeptide ABC transporter n=1 Tax=Gaiella occulta TaxID=1002870 RepID=A0A7M2YYR3_9ACTN|nr:ABC transporter ATP-binding protein [Gaiella occulta]RDI74617.1 oligo-HPY: oligopeptide/dipeptide ABC transporter [Gaiella occulta]